MIVELVSSGSTVITEDEFHELLAIAKRKENVSIVITVPASISGEALPEIPPEEEDPEITYREARAIAKPGKIAVVCWEIVKWNDAHEKDPPQERGAELAHPIDMGDRTFIPDGSIVHVFPDSIKADGGGRAFLIHDAPEARNSDSTSIAITGGLYMKDTELEF